MTKSILKRLKKEHAPLIDGDTATFVWRGEKAPALVGDFTGWDAGVPAEMVESAQGLWTYQLCLPEDAYIEYSYQQDGESVPDPYNPRLSPNGMGRYNHYLNMPGYQPSSLSEKKAHIKHGEVTRHVVSTDYLVFGKKRIIYLYQPPVEKPVPLIVVWDGQDYLHRMHLNTILDNLIAEERIQPLALALVSNGGQVSRAIEYACNEANIVFLMTSVLPLAVKELNLVDFRSHPGEYCVAGASMGGLMALYTGVRVPQVFGKVLSQSGAFTWGGLDMVVFDLLQHGDQRKLQIWMDVGIYDLPGLLPANQRMKELLDQRGYEAEYREYHAGHNYPAWRDDIWRGLEALFKPGN